MLAEWFGPPHVAEIWDAPRSFPDIREEYLPKLYHTSDVKPYVAYLDHEAAGYIQFYVAVETSDGWWPGQDDPGVLGIDLFLSDEGSLGQGLGTRMVRAFVDFLFKDPSIWRVQVDPAPENSRAIRPRVAPRSSRLSNSRGPRTGERFGLCFRLRTAPGFPDGLFPLSDPYTSAR